MNRTDSTAASTIDIASLLAEFDVSGLSAAAFARSRGVASWRIYHALNRRSGKSRAGSAAATRPALLPVRVVPEESAVRAEPTLVLELAGGRRLRIGSDFDAVLLRRVLEALARC